VPVEPRLPKPDDPSVLVGFAVKALPNVDDLVSVEAPPNADGLSLSPPKAEPVDANAEAGLPDAAAPNGDLVPAAALPNGDADLAKEPKPEEAKAVEDVCGGGDFELDVTNGEVAEALAKPLDGGI
jgi:hypothetical protein